MNRQDASIRLSDEVPATPVRVPRPRIGRQVGGALALIVAGLIVASLITNPNYKWDVVWDYLFAGRVMYGLMWTLILTVLSMLIGIVLGTLLALMRRSANRITAGCASVYIWFFRGTPLLVQLIVWFNLASLYPTIELGVPFTGLTFFSAPTNDVISPLTAALLGLGLNQAAYTAEIIRAGIISVPPTQLDAAASLGMTKFMAMRRIVLPQAMRVIIPPIGNETIGMLKTTSMVSVLAMTELLYSVQLIYARTYETIPLLIVASIWYLVMTTVLTLIQTQIENRLKHDDHVTGQQGRATRLRAFAVRALRTHAVEEVK